MYTIYGADWCGYCTKAKVLLESKGLEYKVINIEDEGTTEMFKRIGFPVKTIPQIFNGDEYVGRYNDLIYELENA